MGAPEKVYIQADNLPWTDGEARSARQYDTGGDTVFMRSDLCLTMAEIESVKRYWLDGVLQPNENSAWVRISDLHAMLEKRGKK